MAGSLVCLSERPEDISFAKKVSELNSMSLEIVLDVRNLANVLRLAPVHIIFWDIDHPKASVANDPQSVEIAGKLLRGLSSPENIFAISDTAVSHLPHFDKETAACYLRRNLVDPAAEVISYLIRTILTGEFFGASKYVPSGVQVQPTLLNNSRQRKMILDTMTKLLQSKSLAPQVMPLAIRAVDEIIMNAVFDAPNKFGAAYRRHKKRESEFMLEPKEQIHIEYALTPHYLVITVRDQFGSFKKEDLLEVLSADYEKYAYKAKADEEGAGLGLYDVVQSGISLSITLIPKMQTQAALFIPLVQNFRQFRAAFNFVSFIEREAKTK